MALVELTTCTVDLDTGRVLYRDGSTDQLSPTHRAVLDCLALHRGHVVSRDTLNDEVWSGRLEPTSRAADTAMASLRRQLEADPRRPDHLLTMFNEGYQLVALETHTARTNLVAPRDALIGRSAELTALCTAMRGAPGLWTLTGAPGVGKTRLAEAVARRMTGELLGGAWLCDLRELRSEAELLRALATSLGVPPLPGASPGAALHRLRRVLRERGATVVVLDNAEVVAPACAAVADDLLRHAPELRLLVTSRSPVGAGAEQVVPLAPLEPDDAAALFQACARRVRSEVQLDADAVAELVEKLDRLPLALVLAAGRLSALSVPALLARLGDRFQLLESRRRDASPRERTLRGALDVSWESLDPEARGALAACSAFRGGFTTRAVAVVLDTAAPEALLERLVVASLLTRRGTRWDLLTSIREYAAARLAEDPRARAVAWQRHGAALAQLRPDSRHTPALGLSAERANLVVAAARAVERRDAAVAVPIACALAQLAEVEGPLDLGTRAVEAALDLGLDPGSAEAVELRTWRGVLAWRQARNEEAEDELRAALSAAEAQGRIPVARMARGALAGLLFQIGRMDEARALNEDEVRVCREQGDLLGEAAALGRLGAMLDDLGRPEEARVTLQAALRATQAAGDRRGEAVVRCNYGMFLRLSGDTAASERELEDALAIFQELGDRIGQAATHNALACLDSERGRLDEALDRLARGRALAREAGEPRLEAVQLGGLGEVQLAMGDLDAARRTLERALLLHEELATRRSACVVHLNLAAVELAVGALDRAEDIARHALAEASAMGIETLQGVAWRRLGSVALARGDLDGSRDALEAAARALGRSSAHEQGLLCCDRAALAAAEGTDPGPHLERAVSLLERLGDGPDSSLGRRVASLRTPAGG